MSSPTSPDATATYTLAAVPAGAANRVYWYAATATSPTVVPAPTSGSKVQLGTGDGKSPLPLKISNGTQASPVYVAIVIQDSNGMALTPLGIVVKRAPNQLGGPGNDPQAVLTFPSATISGTTLSLGDTENDIASYDFDILFRDSSGNYGLLDPKILNT